MITFSIIIPVYNVLPYLHACVSSVLGQSYTDFELILINDGSTDGSGHLCDQLALSDPRIRVIHQKNRGLSGARNAGIDTATGKYIIFLDSDDFWHDNGVLARLAQRLSLTAADVLSFNYVKYDGHAAFSPYFSAETMPKDTGDSFAYLSRLGLWIACAWNKVIRRSLFSGGELRFIEGITSEDMDWCIRLALKARSYDYLNTVGLCYRQRAVSISQSISPHKVCTVIHNIESCIALLDNSDHKHVPLLRPFVGYQYGTLLFHLAKLPKSKQKKDLIASAKKLRYLLKWSSNTKIRILNCISAVFGLNFTLFLLRLK
jgi:glycosyltransferase involved in cell wall biosynthesis